MTKTTAPSASRMTAGAPDQPKAPELDNLQRFLIRELREREHVTWPVREQAASELERLASVVAFLGPQTTAQADLLEALKVIRDSRSEVAAHGCPGADCAICTAGWGRLYAALASTAAPVDDAEEQVRVIAGTQSNPNPEGG